MSIVWGCKPTQDHLPKLGTASFQDLCPPPVQIMDQIVDTSFQGWLHFVLGSLSLHDLLLYFFNKELCNLICIRDDDERNGSVGGWTWKELEGPKCAIWSWVCVLSAGEMIQAPVPQCACAPANTCVSLNNFFWISSRKLVTLRERHELFFSEYSWVLCRSTWSNLAMLICCSLVWLESAA